ncbi:MAG: glycosyltransferase [Acidobacteria bacterium]|nr:glycosyltransferase [Acidobacteriota bacterium]
MTSPAVAAVVPARNEERRVGATVRALRAIPAVEEVVVVDDVSADATAEEARAAGARVLRPARRHLRAGRCRAPGRRRPRDRPDPERRGTVGIRDGGVRRALGHPAPHRRPHGATALRAARSPPGGPRPRRRPRSGIRRRGRPDGGRPPRGLPGRRGSVRRPARAHRAGPSGLPAPRASGPRPHRLPASASRRRQKEVGMTVVLLSLVPALVAFAVTARTARFVGRSAPLRRSNYRGIEVAAGGGIAPLAGLTVAAGLVALAHAVAPGSPRVAAAALVDTAFLQAALGFGLLGLWDDLAAGPGRGWRAHLVALARGRPESGAIKLGAGAALAVAIVAPYGRSLGWILADAAIVALSANLFNLLDVRPGRAGKFTVLAAVPLLAVGGPTAPAIAAALGGTLAFLPFDLRERVMLGDAGANGLGAIIGVATVAVGSDTARLVALGLLAILHVVADGPSLSRGIGAIRPLRALDRAGRLAE